MPTGPDRNPSLLVWPREQHREADPATPLGGKVHGLIALERASMVVPPFFVVAPQGTALLFEAARVRETIGPVSREADAAALHDVEARARHAFETAPFPPALALAIAEAWTKLSASSVAVRSSATDEDSAARSFAGQLDSVLFVSSPSAVCDAVRRCCASAFSARALAYRLRAGLDPTDVSLALIVQEMVEGDVSGVMFTTTPDGDENAVAISAARGLCEGVVQGSVPTDEILVDKVSGRVTVSPQTKGEQVVRTPLGTAVAPVPEALQDTPCLDDDEARALASMGAQLAERFGAPQDIEWTRKDGRFVFLQARPITTLGGASTTSLPTQAGASTTIWDNSNIVESYSGVTSPMTYSYIRYAYAIAYQQSCEISGVPRAEIKAHENTFKSMLGYVDGRVYYNLRSWYRLLSLFPGFEKNRVHMERMMGVRESARIIDDMPVRTAGQKLGIAYAMLRNFVRVDRFVADFEQRFAKTYGAWEERDWEALSLDEVVASYHELIQRFLWNWQAPLITDFCAMLFYGALRDKTVQWGIDENGALHNDLLCGEGGIESTEPTKALMRLAARIKERPDALALVESTPDRALLAALEADPRHADLVDELRLYLKKWGLRCMNELKLEEPSLRDDPSFLFAMLKNYVRLDDLDVPAMEAREQAKRRAAEEAVAQKLKSPIRKLAMRFLVGQARKHVKNRENMRFARTKTFGLLRAMLNRIGKELHARKLLDDPRDVYMLEIDEVVGFVDGSATCTDLRGLARLRRVENDRYRALPEPDDRFTTTGAVHIGNAFRSAPSASAGALRGTPCSPGRVRGPVRVIRSPKDDLTLRGEILVAARTDPGWVPLYPSASGLLIERGSVLSHSAIVARELGLPTIVNVPHLLELLRDGMIVEMDATTGTIEIIDDTPAALSRAAE